MNLIDKPWKRIVISLLAGAFVAEVIKINSADANHKTSVDFSSHLLLLFAVIAYVVLTALSKKNNK